MAKGKQCHAKTFATSLLIFPPDQSCVVLLYEECCHLSLFGLEVSVYDSLSYLCIRL
jgi:hypothetical protein